MACAGFLQNLYSRKRSVWEKKKAEKKTASSEEDRSLYLIYECLRVTGANDSVENYTDLFTIVIRNDDIQEFDSKWDEFLLSHDANPI